MSERSRLESAIQSTLAQGTALTRLVREARSSGRSERLIVEGGWIDFDHMKAWVIAEDSAGKAVREDRVFGPVLYVRNLRGEAAKKKRVWTREAFGKTGVGHRAYLDLLKGARRVRAAGAPQLRADEREQFEVEIDVSALDAGEHAATVGRSILVQGGLDTDVLPASVWLDDGGRVRRVCFRVPETQGSGLREQWTAEFFDFGSPGAAEEPDKSQIARMRSWLISRVN